MYLNIDNDTTLSDSANILAELSLKLCARWHVLYVTALLSHVFTKTSVSLADLQWHVEAGRPAIVLVPANITLYQNDTSCFWREQDTVIVKVNNETGIKSELLRPPSKLYVMLVMTHACHLSKEPCWPFVTMYRGFQIFTKVIQAKRDSCSFYSW